MSCILLTARSIAAPSLILLSLGACRAPETDPLETAELVSAVSARDASPAELGAALELAGLRPLALAPPTEEALLDPQRAEFWHACAWAWSPTTREARRRLQAAQARAGSAGRPQPIRASIETRELDDPDANSRLMLTFDLLGLLGIGPAAAARALADAETRAALSGLEEAMWAARFDVDAARVRLAAVRAARADLDALHQEAEDEVARIEILDRNGRIATGALASARLALHKLAEQREQLAQDEARAREALAIVAGLTPEASALDANGRELIEQWLMHAVDRSNQTEVMAAELLERVPQLRGLLLDYAIAEARLRETASRRWPSLALGPHLFWGDSDLLLGSVISSGLPWPDSLDGEIAAVSVEREAARERIEDGLLAVQAGRRSALQRQAAALDMLEQGSLPVADQSARLWTAARARFAVDPQGLEAWAHALTERMKALRGLHSARAEAVLAAMEIERLTGPSSDLPRLVAASLTEESR